MLFTRFTPLSVARTRLGLLALAIALIASACTWEKAESASPSSLPFGDDAPIAETTTSSSSTTSMAPVGCVGGYFSINYPSGWTVADRSANEQCFWFSSAAIGNPNSEDFPADFVPEITVITERSYEQSLTRLTSFEGSGYGLIDSNALIVNGYPATMFDVVSEAPALGTTTIPDGLRSRLVIVDVDGGAITMRATEATVATGGPGVDYSETLNALDMILNSLIIPR